MRKLVGIAAASAVVLGAGVWVARVNAAGTDSSSITLQGQVNNTCGFTANPTSSLTTNAVLTDPTVAAPIVTFDLVNSTNAHLKGNSIRLTFSGVCNYSPYVMSLRSTKGGMIAGAAPAASVSGFVTRVDYSALATWGNAAANVITDGTQNHTSISSTVTSPRVGTLRLDIAIDPGTVPVVAGYYTDTLILQLGAPF